MNNAKLFNTITTLRSETKRRVRAFAASTKNKCLIREVEQCLEVNEARLLTGLSEEAYECLVMYEEMYSHLKTIARLSK